MNTFALTDSVSAPLVRISCTIHERHQAHDELQHAEW